jgi:hypothetical protein
MKKKIEDENRKQSDEVTLTITRQQLIELMELGKQPIEVDTPKDTETKKPPPESQCDNTGLNGTPWSYQYLTEEQMAAKVQCCTKTLQKLRKKEKISYHQMGKFIRYSPEDVANFHNSTYVPAKKKDNEDST